MREIDYLGRLFEEVTHIAPVYSGAAPETSIPYQSSRIVLKSVPPAGGSGIKEKFDLLMKIPAYVKVLFEEFHKADVVHVRCPANISLIAIVLLGFLRRPLKRWVKYAGNWQPDGPEPWSYTFQRWWLRKGFHRGIVTINGEWPDQPKHIYSFLNPCITEEELKEAQKLTEGKILNFPPKLLFVGRLESAKGVGRVLRILKELHAKGCKAELDLIGDGPERAKFESETKSLELQPFVRFHGWLSRNALPPIYTEAHFIVFPTTASEGWPKVLSEAMAYGVIPIASTVSSIPQYLEKFKVGRTFEAHKVEKFSETILEYLKQPELWKQESEKAAASAALFTYEAYLKRLSEVLDLTNPYEP